MDHVNAVVAGLDGSACGEPLIALGGVQAAVAGASTEDLAAIAACATEAWRAQQPGAADPDPDDRAVRLGTTFGSAGVIRGGLTPECSAAVRAVLEALGKKAGPEGDRTEPQRFRDALRLACTLPRASPVRLAVLSRAKRRGRR